MKSTGPLAGSTRQPLAGRAGPGCLLLRAPWYFLLWTVPAHADPTWVSGTSQVAFGGAH